MTGQYNEDDAFCITVDSFLTNFPRKVISPYPVGVGIYRGD